jgi:hypothetical protein
MSAGLPAGHLYVGSDNLVEWDGLLDNLTEEYINDATIAFVLKPAAGGSNVASGSLDYVADSDGLYRGTIEEDTSLTVGTKYALEVTATASGDRVDFRRIEYTARYRGVE